APQLRTTTQEGKNNRSNSQASVDSTSMEDFWCEVESIKENSEQGQEEQTLLEVKPADGEHTNSKLVLPYFTLTKFFH
uniref:Uncharacterized protein n=1 Tax=Terrapene triunguis TaxID=2587831 RepID=A0A674JDU6_9SAUR